MLNIYKNYSWNYNKALLWLKKKQQNAINYNEESLAFGSHNPCVITFGRNILNNDFLDFKAIKKHKITIKKTERGGGITMHNLGQLVVYPVIILTKLGIGIKDFTYLLESCMIEVLNNWNITAHRNINNPGIYVKDHKIGFIGFNVSKGVITHGMCMNINNNLSLYSHFRPCRQKNITITSLSKIIEQNVKVKVVGEIFQKTLIKHLLNPQKIFK